MRLSIAPAIQGPHTLESLAWLLPHLFVMELTGLSFADVDGTAACVGLSVRLRHRFRLGWGADWCAKVVSFCPVLRSGLSDALIAGVIDKRIVLRGNATGNWL
jgi:hypothetical protein